MNVLANILIDGIAYSMVLFMVAVGLSMTLGLMRFINLAHGAFAMLGGFAMVFLPGWLGIRLELAVVLSVALMALLALPIERVLVRPFYHRDHLDQMLLTIGLMFFATAAASYFFGPNVQLLRLPDYMTGSADLGFRMLPRHRLWVIGAGIVVMLVLWLTIDKSRFGIKVRAAVDNPAIAQSIGINTSLIYAATFSLGAALAAVGGIFGAELMPIEPTSASRYLVILLAVVAIGGYGTIAGSFVAALILGLAETSAKYLLPGLAPFVMPVTMFVVLLMRPKGLFGKG